MSEYTTEEILKLIKENNGPEGLDLSGKDLAGIDLGREKIAAALKKARKRVPGETPVWYSEETKGINLQRISLENANLKGAFLLGADLRNASLWEADLQGANLWVVDLRSAVLSGANLQGASLVFANLQGANLVGANLHDADLRYARLQKVTLSGCIITHIYISGARLDKTRLQWEQLGGAIGEELGCEYGEAKYGYLILKQNFDDLGDYDAAGRAYCKERRMEKLEALQKAKQAWQKYDWKGAIPRYTKAAIDQLVEWICDYGESVPRVLCSLLAVYLLFTLIYGLTWSVIRVHATPAAITREPTRNLVDLARFSLGAMTTMDLTGLEPRNGLVELLAGVEALLGIALTGLLGFVAGNRIRRS